MARGIVSTIRPGVLCVLAAVTAAGVPAPAQDLTFTDITKEAGAGGPAAPGKTGGHGAMFADVDGDGDIDILCANRTGEVNILRNDGGKFQAITARSVGIEHRASDGISAADVDNDRDLDLLLAGDSNGYL